MVQMLLCNRRCSIQSCIHFIISMLNIVLFPAQPEERKLVNNILPYPVTLTSPHHPAQGPGWLAAGPWAPCGVLLGWEYRPAPGKTNQAHANTASQHIVHIFKVEISSKIRRKYVIIMNVIITPLLYRHCH